MGLTVRKSIHWYSRAHGTRQADRTRALTRRMRRILQPLDHGQNKADVPIHAGRTVQPHVFGDEPDPLFGPDLVLPALTDLYGIARHS